MKKANSQKPNTALRSVKTLATRKVVLYKHGVGYFERLGTVSGDASVDLHFKASEMNDVLKSLTALDLGDGIIASISYESTRPIDKQLEELSISISDRNALTELLTQVKGARVALTLGAKKVEGTIVGIETVTRKDRDATLTSSRLALLVDGESLQSYDVLDISSTVLLDDNVRQELRHLLDILKSANKKDRKKLTVFAKGHSQREILVSYVVETPVWKTSYRVLLSREKPVIQGWALVDNTQDEDWDNIELTLVAGLPVSFVHDLYTPRYKTRPIVQVPDEAAYAPPVLEQAEEGFAEAEGPDFMGSSVAPAPIAAGLQRAKMAGNVHERAVHRTRSVEIQTRTVEVGDLFHYEITNPITVKRGQSALVPILQTPFDGKRVAVYNPDVREKNPMSAVLFKNNTGMTLEGGPMTILEDDRYVGEAMLDTLKPDEERVVPYSVELACVISVDHSDTDTAYHFSRIAQGSLYVYGYTLNRRTYIVNNKGDKKLDLFIEHRFRQGWELVQTEIPVERTANFYRFRIEASPKQTTKFSVTERGDTHQTAAIQNVSRDTVRVWLESKYIDNETAAQLQDLTAKNDAIAALEQQIGTLEEEIKAIFKDQERQRKNLQALGNAESERELRERYVSEMAHDEDKLKDHREELRRLRKKKEHLEGELRQQVMSLHFEHRL